MASNHWQFTNGISNQHYAYGAPSHPVGMQLRSVELSPATPGRVMPTSCSNSTDTPLQNMTVTPITARYTPHTPLLTREMAEARMFGTVNPNSAGSLLPQLGKRSPAVSPPISLRRSDSIPLRNPFRKHKDNAPVFIPGTAPLDGKRSPAVSPPISLRRSDSIPLRNPFRKHNDNAPVLIPGTAPLDGKRSPAVLPPISLRRSDSIPLRNPFRKHNDNVPALIPDTAPLDDVARALGITDALATLKKAAAACSIPVLSEAAEVAMSILAVVSNTVRRARINDVGSTSLASHACNLISYIVAAQQRREKEGRSLDQGLLEELRMLVEVLNNIKNFLQQLNGRNRLLKAVMYKSDAEKVKIQQETLTQALAEFQFRSSINDQLHVAHIDQRLQDILISMKSKTGLPSPTAAPAAITRELNDLHYSR